ncbi:RHS repeat domain-containing protein [Nocardiopsis alba]|uniref:RHS repeat domain-containing protein n=1 Tax=Nocardiopsis alba TaxID=53437 RepID=UPI0036735D51
MAIVVAAGLVGSVPASALGYNNRPDVELEESVAGADAALPVIEPDTSVADAAITSLDDAEWPIPEKLTFSQVESYASPQAGDIGAVSMEGVTQNEFEEWSSPLPDVPGSSADSSGEVSESERRIPRDTISSDDEENAPEVADSEEMEERAPDPLEDASITEEEATETEDEEAENEPGEEEHEPVADPSPVVSAELEVLSRSEATELGLSGLALRLTRTDDVEEAGPVRVKVDYTDFASAYGADYGSRLDLVALAEEEDRLTTHPLDSNNDASSQSLTALAPATGEGVLLAVVANAQSEGGAGDFTATSLSPSSTWNVGPQTGNFSWAYPFAVPSVAGSLEPEIALGYSSQSVDGRTSDTNNQTSWIGEGFDYNPGYIERQYTLCQNDGTRIPDLCWSRHNAVLHLGGISTELLYVDGEWTPKSDDGSKIERLTGATNGDDDGEHWKVTTTDGTRYFFGLNRLPGHSSGDDETNSAWTVPVFGNDRGEPCYSSNLSNAWCDQAWRWNLDYVVDLQGNALAHYYETETNNYGLNFGSDPVEYDRGGYLKRTSYGLRDDDAQATAPAQVLYTVGERCVDEDFGCAEKDRKESNAEYWPDTPLDQECTDNCAGQHNATFWSTKKLEKITTRLRDGGEYVTVDTWELEHSFPKPGDGTSPALWLDSITHTGHAGGESESYPAVTFVGTSMPNRIDSTGDGLAPMNKWRITGIHTETGGQVDVSYAEPDCDPDDLPTAHTNTQLCYPVIRTHRGGAEEITDWFAKYAVTALVERDLVGGQPDVVTDYDYVGDGAWRYMDADGFVDDDRRTWSQWRGFDRVIVRTGHPEDVRTETEYLFYQGMDDDRLPSGTRSVQVTDSTGTSVDDHEVFNGQIREVIVRDGVGGEVLSKSITTPWKRRTAERTFSWGTVEAHMVGVERTDRYQALEDGTFRHSRTSNEIDSYGMISAVHDFGDVEDETDHRCTTNTYARNTDLHLLDLIARSRTVAVPCGETPSLPEDVISDTRYLYDGRDFGEAPTRGLVTAVQNLEEVDEGTSKYLTSSKTTFDEYGRSTSGTDAEGNTTSVRYTDLVAGGALSKMVTTNPLGHEQTLEVDHRSQPVSIRDANENVTRLAYDSLGRLTEAWLADRTGTQEASPSLRFEYAITKDRPSTVTTHALGPNGDYVTQTQILDGLLRTRQFQAPAPGGGRVLSDTFYDSRGNAVIEREPYYNEDEPSEVLFEVANSDKVPRWQQVVFDGSGRITDEIHMSKGVEQWRSTTEYRGEKTLFSAPEGGVGTTVIKDARGNVVEQRDHHGPIAEGEYDSTHYTYTPAGQLETVTDPGGNVWSYTYDLLGRMVKSDDPDSGTSTIVYDDLGRPVSTTDARGESLYSVYDELGRRLEEREGSETGELRAQWVYDTVKIGQLGSATRFDGGSAYTSRILDYDPLYRPLVQEIGIPETEGELAGNYRFSMLYNPDGSLEGMRLPAVGNLPTESLSYGYDDLGNPSTLVGRERIVSETVYSKVGNLVQREFRRRNVGADQTWVTRGYDEKTDRLNKVSLVNSSGSGALADQRYDYDDAGNLLRLANEPTDTSLQSDVQCFEYDHLRRLSQVWTPDATGEEACAAEPEITALGGAAPYWREYTYDEVGNRLEEIDHTPAGPAVRTYQRPEEGEGPAHGVAEVIESGVSGSGAHSYEYDQAGNTITRSTDTGSQTLEWGAGGELAKVVEEGRETEFLYTADGERLMRKTDEEATLYLPGNEVTWSFSEETESATRYYDHAGETVAVRENDGTLLWVFSDHHGTGEILVDAVWGDHIQRRMTVFGETRGAGADWRGERGFVNGVIDESIGLTQLGARSYDAALGRFISVDPLIDHTDPQQMHGYAYARNNPTTYSDADGLFPKKKPCACPIGGGSKGWGSGGSKGPGKGLGPKPSKPGGGLTGLPNLGGGSGGGWRGGGSSGGWSGGGGSGGGWSGGGSGGGWGGWGVSGGSRGPSAPAPAPPPYVEVDYVDPEEVALGAAGHDGTPWGPGEHWGQCDTPGVVAAVGCSPVGSLKDGINEIIDLIPPWMNGPITFILGVSLVIYGVACAWITAGICILAGAGGLAALGALVGIFNYRIATREEDRNLWDYFWAGLTGAAAGGAVGRRIEKMSRDGWRVVLSWPPRISMPPRPSGR